MNNIEDIDWFAIKVRFNRALSANQEILDNQIETYFPLEMRGVPTKGGKIRSKMMPVFSNLVFVKTSFKMISAMCGVHKDWFYLSNTIDGQKRAIRIPETQMKQFQDFIAGNYDNIEYKKTKFKKGEKVIVKSGLFKGSEAIYIEEKGKKYKEYILEIANMYITITENNGLEKA